MRVMKAMKTLGHLSRMDAREVWSHEAHDFTPWLYAHLPLLAEALGLDIEPVGSEVKVGDFAVDIVGRTAPGGRSVIVENQLSPTDHGHLGQLLTYASGLDATVIVWLAPQFRDEHRQAIDWLNGHTTEDVDFFGVELELLRIDDSAPAPHFKLAAAPNTWAKQTRESAPAAATERGLRYTAFFEAVLAEFKKRRPGLTSTSKVRPDNWLSFSAKRSGFIYSWSVAGGNRLRVEVYIDTGEQESTKAYFDSLYARREELEAAVGAEFAWERLDNRRASRIALYNPKAVGPSFDTDPEAREWMVQTMALWTDVFGPVIAALPPAGGPPTAAVG
jgi:hypothetical protein